MHPSFQTLAGNAGLEEKKGRHNDHLRLLPVQHEVVVLVEGYKRRLQLIDVKLPRVLVRRSRGDPDKAQLRKAVAYLEREVDVTAGADDRCLHGSPLTSHYIRAGAARETPTRPEKALLPLSGPLAPEGPSCPSR